MAGWRSSLDPILRWCGYLMFPPMRFARWLSLSPFLGRITNGIRLPGRIPWLADIDGRYLAPPVELTFKGRRSMSAPTLEITIDPVVRKTKPRALEDVVALFPGRKKFIFNVSFSCGRGGWRGVYADPASIWFNIFFGYYQIDVSQREWGRPFGYERADARSAIHTSDLMRIAEADWNHFSNFLYGVPLAVAQEYDDRKSDRAHCQGRISIGNRQWDHLTLDDVQVTSAYVQEVRQLNSSPHPWLRGLWRAAFGGPRPRPTLFREPFLPTQMKGRLLMAWIKDDRIDRDLNEPVYRTYIFGATIDKNYPERAVRAQGDSLGEEKARAVRAEAEADNAAFLETQSAAIETLILKNYAHLGFAHAD